MDEIEDMDLTSAEEKRFKRARSCYICRGSFNGEEDPKGYKVRDQCQFTGKHPHTHMKLIKIKIKMKGEFRGAAHRKCNL